MKSVDEETPKLCPKHIRLAWGVPLRSCLPGPIIRPWRLGGHYRCPTQIVITKLVYSASAA